jgi:hypothetical protein
MKILLSLCLLLSTTVLASELTLTDVIQQNTKAVGGKAAMDSVKTIQVSLTIEEPSFKVDAIYVAERKGRMRIDIYSEGKRVYTEAYDGTKGWQMNEAGVVTDSSLKGSAALLHGVILPGKFYGFEEMAELGHQLELVGRENIEGIQYYVLKLTLKDGYTQKYYIHPETWLVERSRVERALHPDVDPTPTLLEDRYLDYRDVEGIQRSFQMDEYDVVKGTTLQKSTVKEFKYNVPVTDSIFVKPKS